MEKKTKIILGVVGAIITVTLGIIIYRKFSAPDLGADLTPDVTPDKNVGSVRTDIFPLIKGSKGNNVTKLQQTLNRLGATLKVDGDFGPLTYNALTSYGSDKYPVSIAVYNGLVAKSNELPTNANTANNLFYSNDYKIWQQSKQKLTFADWMKLPAYQRV